MNLSEQNSGVCASTNLPALPSQRAQPVTKNVMFLIFQTKRYRDFGIEEISLQRVNNPVQPPVSGIVYKLAASLHFNLVSRFVLRA